MAPGGPLVNCLRGRELCSRSRPAAEDVLLAEIYQGVVVQPLAGLVGARTPQDRLVLLPLDDDQVLWLELVHEGHRLRADDDLGSRGNAPQQVSQNHQRIGIGAPGPARPG